MKRPPLVLRLLFLALAVAFTCTVAPAQTEPPANEAALNVVSYNIRHGEGMDNRLDLQRTAETLRKLRPDLIALQEVDCRCTRSGSIDEARALGEMLDMHPAFGKFMDYQGGQYGLAILSRFPIEKVIRHPLPDGREPRCALEVVVRPREDGPPVSLVCLHLDWTTEALRVPQIEALIRALADRKHPVILAGDFNAERDSKTIQLVREAGWTMIEKTGDAKKTWPADQPRVEIDFVMLRGLPHPEKATCRVVDEPQASDHRPLTAAIPLDESK